MIIIIIKYTHTATTHNKINIEEVEKKEITTTNADDTRTTT